MTGDSDTTQQREWCIGARTLYGKDHGDKVHGFAQRIIGHPCPCTYGLACPILPAPVPDPEPTWGDSWSTFDSVPPESLTRRG